MTKSFGPRWCFNLDNADNMGDAAAVPSNSTVTAPNTSSPSVLLMGLRASGKSTVGRLVAQRLSRTFIDLDRRTLAAFADCRSVSDAWRTHGEQAWRAAEAAAYETAMQEAGAVMALGGGTPMIPAAQQSMQAARDRGKAILVHLHCDAVTLRARLASDPGDRPGLRGSNPLDEIEAIMAEREPVYRALADFRVDATGVPERVADDILSVLTQRGG